MNDQKIEEEYITANFFSAFFIFALIFNLNIGVHQHGKIVTQRKKIYIYYYQRHLIYDVLTILIMLFNSGFYANIKKYDHWDLTSFIVYFYRYINLLIVAKLLTIWGLYEKIERELNLIGFKA